MQPGTCTNTHHVTDLVNHGMVKNTKPEILKAEINFPTK